MNENEAERKTMMSRPIPARPKGAPVPTPPPPLDELLQKRQAHVRNNTGAVKFEFVDEEEKTPTSVQEALDYAGMELNKYDAFHDFVEIMRTLRKYPKPTRKQMVGLIAEMMLE